MTPDEAIEKACVYVNRPASDWSPLAAERAHEILAIVAAEAVAVRAELAALKARRCDGCAHYAATPLYPSGRCDLPTSAINAPMELDSPSPVVVELLVDADFSCAAWTEKP